jgi:hypothetical protein
MRSAKSLKNLRVLKFLYECLMMMVVVVVVVIQCELKHVAI